MTSPSEFVEGHPKLARFMLDLIRTVGLIGVIALTLTAYLVWSSERYLKAIVIDAVAIRQDVSSTNEYMKSHIDSSKKSQDHLVYLIQRICITSARNAFERDQCLKQP